MRASGAAKCGPIPQFDVTLLAVVRAKEAPALRALALRLPVAAPLSADLTCVAFADSRLSREVLDQVLFLAPAVLRTTDLLSIA